PAVLQLLRAPRPRRVRRLLGHALLADRNKEVERTGLSAWIARWWTQKDSLSQRRVVELLDLLEFIFPRVGELKRRYRIPWAAAVFRYPHHVVTGLLRCGRHFGPPAYWALRERAGRLVRGQ